MASKKEIERLRKLGVIQQAQITGSSWQAIYQQLEAHVNKEGRLEEEWKALNEVERRKDHLFSDGRQEYNKAKNRYMDVLPYNATRVRLMPIKTELGSDYINASHVACGRMQFIQAQAPPPGCFADFYRMLWEYHCSCVIMLTRWVEGGRVKADNYLPPNTTETVTYGNISVQMLSEEEPSEHFIVRQLKLKQKAEERLVVHYQYVSWPDRGVPEDSASILEMMTLIYKSKTFSLDSQQVVHCSAGIGRSGAWVVIAGILDEITHELGTNNFPVINIMKAVDSLRSQRAGTVQQIDQYKLIYKTVLDHIHKINDSKAYKETIRNLSMKRAQSMRRSRGDSLPLPRSRRPSVSTSEAPTTAAAAQETVAHPPTTRLPSTSISSDKSPLVSKESIKSGYLAMPRGFSWRKFWCVLTSRALYIYKDNKEGQVVKEILLHRSTIIEEETMITRPHTIHIATSKHYNLSAGSEAEKNEWMQALKNVVSAIPEVKDSPPPEVQVLQIYVAEMNNVGTANILKAGQSFRVLIKLKTPTEKKALWKAKTQWVRPRDNVVTFNESFITIDRNITPLLKIYIKLERMSGSSSLSAILDSAEISLDKFVSSQQESDEITALFASKTVNVTLRVALISMSSNPKQRRKTDAPPPVPAKKPLQSKVFGVTLEQQVEFQNTLYPDLDVPYFLDCCIQAIIDMNGATTEGIFRIPANFAEVQMVKESVDRTMSKDIKKGDSVHIPCALLKLWLRELPEPLIPPQLYETCVTHPESAFDVITRIPELNRKVLVKLLDFLYFLLKPEHVQYTKMTKENLATVFSPCLLVCPYTDPFMILYATKMEIQFVIALLSNPEIMGIENNEKEPEPKSEKQSAKEIEKDKLTDPKEKEKPQEDLQKDKHEDLQKQENGHSLEDEPRTPAPFEEHNRMVRQRGKLKQQQQQLQQPPLAQQPRQEAASNTISGVVAPPPSSTNRGSVPTEASESPNTTPGSAPAPGLLLAAARIQPEEEEQNNKPSQEQKEPKESKESKEPAPVSKKAKQDVPPKPEVPPKPTSISPVASKKAPPPMPRSAPGSRIGGGPTPQANAVPGDSPTTKPMPQHPPQQSAPGRSGPPPAQAPSGPPSVLTRAPAQGPGKPGPASKAASNPPLGRSGPPSRQPAGPPSRTGGPGSTRDAPSSQPPQRTAAPPSRGGSFIGRPAQSAANPTRSPPSKTPQPVPGNRGPPPARQPPSNRRTIE